MMVPYWFPARELKDLGRFREFHKLSEGGYGEIFSCIWKRPDGVEEKVVVKRLLPSFSTLDLERRKNFLREARILRELAHPGIPKYYDGFQSDEESFFIIQFVQGIDLNKALYHAKIANIPPSAEFAFWVTKKTLETLDYLHSFEHAQGPLIHGDIKLKNIMVEEDLQLHLLDYTLSIHEKNATRFLGKSLEFAPLEAHVMGSPSKRSDLFSLSVVFFSLLIHERLFPQVTDRYGMFAYLAENKQESRIQSLNLAQPLKSLLLRGLSNPVEKRFASAKEYLEVLHDCAQQMDVPMNENSKNVRDYFKRLSGIRS